MTSPQPSTESSPWWRPALLLFVELSGWIAVPIIIAMYVGQWLDTRYHSEPWLYLTSVALAFVVSTIGIVRGARREMRRLDQEATNKKPPV
ncbi:MAG: AtpZ/AtpI family protein [Patescibacteria group bacterium]